MFQVDLQMAKCCLLDLPANLICKCKSSFQTDQSFFRSTKILEQSKMLMECTCGTSMDFYPHALASWLCTFRAWQEKIECNDTYFQGVLKVSCCNLGDGQSCGEFKHLLFFLI